MAEQNSTGGKSSFKGVDWRADRNCWQARIQIHGKRRTLGYFKTDREAALAYDFAAGKYSATSRSVNFPGVEIPDAIVRAVRPKLMAIDKAAKFDLGILDIFDDEISMEIRLAGALAGDQWATVKQKTAIAIPSDVDLQDPSAMAESIGALTPYDAGVSILKLKTKAKRYLWMKAFLNGASKVWNPPRRTEASPVALSPMSMIPMSETMLKLQKNFGGPTDRLAGMSEKPPILTAADINPSYSKFCNPETLARDNAKNQRAMDEGVGIFGKIKMHKELLAEGYTSSESFRIIDQRENERLGIARFKQPAIAQPVIAQANVDDLLSEIL